MKKLFIALAFILMAGIASAPLQAQTAGAKTHMKKDGTPDRRYKENKAATTKVGPMKKDGTADMRYKSNNAKAGTKKAMVK